MVHDDAARHHDEHEHHVALGRTGIKVSPYSLGTLMFATSMGNDAGDSARIMHKAIDAGINVVDTADAYGDSDEVVGKALQGRRDDVVLATKFSRPTGHDPNHQGASRRWIVTAVENSLRRLRTDHIDLYQLHRPDPDTDIEETLAALTDLIRSGKVRAIGTSQTRVRRDHNDLSRAGVFRHLTDERRLDVVEQLVPSPARRPYP
ncbi:MAG TPA: aldo/keto reductase [Actinophytocola sp.]|nr:aldo/keto reductase [Actinophytocola sp.]